MGKASKDKRDIYYRRAKEVGFRARSAFKLLQIDRAFGIFRGVRSVVDLCAAPGGWTEVLSQQLASEGSAVAAPQADAMIDGSNSAASSSAHVAAASSEGVRIVAVDLQAMAPLPGVHFIQGDLTRAATAQLILEALGSERSLPAAAAASLSDSAAPRLADLVVCDGAPDVIGLHDVDEAIQHELTLSALNVTLHILREGGSFVAKVFRGRSIESLYALLQKYFVRVSIAKPKASRTSSVESFVVCQEYRGLRALGEEARSMENDPVSVEELPEGTVAAPVPFVSCWDDERLDSDKSYPLAFSVRKLDGSAAHASNSSVIAAAAPYHSLTPSAQPIDPPYRRSLQLKKQNKVQ